MCAVAEHARTPCHHIAECQTKPAEKLQNVHRLPERDRKSWHSTYRNVHDQFPTLQGDDGLAAGMNGLLSSNALKPHTSGLTHATYSPDPFSNRTPCRAGVLVGMNNVPMVPEVLWNERNDTDQAVNPKFYHQLAFGGKLNHRTKSGSIIRSLVTLR